MKKILITGGSGFIAKNLYEGLSSDYSVTSVGRKELDLVDSLKVREFLKKKSFDVVIHSATYDAAPSCSTKDPSMVLENNLKMFFNIARCNDYFGKLIYFGSGAEFARDKWIPQMSEDYFDQHIPTDQYGFSKYIMNKYTLGSENIFNLRLFGVFGKYDDWRYRFIPSICCQAVLGQPIVINQNRRFDFLYINDLVKVVKWVIANHPKKKVYNVCSGKVYDFKTVAQKVSGLSESKLDIIVKKEGLGIEYSGDNSRLMQEMTGIQFWGLDDSVADLFNWYRENKHLLDKSQLSI